MAFWVLEIQIVCEHKNKPFTCCYLFFPSFCLLKRQRNNLGLKEKSLCPVFFRASHPSDGGLNGSSARRRLLSHLRLLSRSFPRPLCLSFPSRHLSAPGELQKCNKRGFATAPGWVGGRSEAAAQQLVKDGKRGPSSLLTKLLTANKCSLRGGGGKTRTERMLSVPGLDGQRFEQRAGTLAEAELNRHRPSLGVRHAGGGAAKASSLQ